MEKTDIVTLPDVLFQYQLEPWLPLGKTYYSRKSKDKARSLPLSVRDVETGLPVTGPQPSGEQQAALAKTVRLGFWN